MSHGTALPHLRIKGILHSEMIMVRTRSGTKVDFDRNLLGDQDADNPIYALFFLASPEDNPGQHLRILAQIATHVDNENFIDQWLDANNEQELKELLLREDRYVSLQLTTGTTTEALINCEIRNLVLPEGSLIAIIHRSGEIIIPRGRTVLHEHDRLTIIGYPKGIQELYDKYLS